MRILTQGDGGGSIVAWRGPFISSIPIAAGESATAAARTHKNVRSEPLPQHRCAQTAMQSSGHLRAGRCRWRSASGRPARAGTPSFSTQPSSSSGCPSPPAPRRPPYSFTLFKRAIGTPAFHVRACVTKGGGGLLATWLSHRQHGFLVLNSTSPAKSAVRPAQWRSARAVAARCEGRRVRLKNIHTIPPIRGGGGGGGEGGGLEGGFGREGCSPQLAVSSLVHLPPGTLPTGWSGLPIRPGVARAENHCGMPSPQLAVEICRGPAPIRGGREAEKGCGELYSSHTAGCASGGKAEARRGKAGVKRGSGTDGVLVEVEHHPDACPCTDPWKDCGEKPRFEQWVPRPLRGERGGPTMFVGEGEEGLQPGHKCRVKLRGRGRLAARPNHPEPDQVVTQRLEVRRVGRVEGLAAGLANCCDATLDLPLDCWDPRRALHHHVRPSQHHLLPRGDVNEFTMLHHHVRIHRRARAQKQQPQGGGGGEGGAAHGGGAVLLAMPVDMPAPGPRAAGFKECTLQFAAAKIEHSPRPIFKAQISGYRVMTVAIPETRLVWPPSWLGWAGWCRLLPCIWRGECAALPGHQRVHGKVLC